MAEGAPDYSLLTVAEVAKMLRLNPQTIRNWIDQGTLPAIRIGRRVRIKREDLEQLLAAGYAPAASRADGSENSFTAEQFWQGEEHPPAMQP